MVKRFKCFGLLVCSRFTLYQRSACPPTIQPYQQTCTIGDASIVYEGMYIEKVIAGLSPYTAYEFQIQSANDAGPIDFPVWVRVETKADGKLVLYTYNTRKQLCGFFIIFVQFYL